MIVIISISYVVCLCVLIFSLSFVSSLFALSRDVRQGTKIDFISRGLRRGWLVELFLGNERIHDLLHCSAFEAIPKRYLLLVTICFFLFFLLGINITIDRHTIYRVFFICHIEKMDGLNSVPAWCLLLFVCGLLVELRFYFLFRCLRGQVPYGRGRDSVVVCFRYYVCLCTDFKNLFTQ